MKRCASWWIATAGADYGYWDPDSFPILLASGSNPGRACAPHVKGIDVMVIETGKIACADGISGDKRVPEICNDHVALH
jgi:hypothetical protein